MGEMKSAFEKAMERVEGIKASPEELSRLKYVPEGEKLAARYLKDECDLRAELDKSEKEVRKHLIDGAREVLLRNIDLPKNDQAKKNNQKAMEGLRLLLRDKAALEKVYAKIKQIFTHYEQVGQAQRKQAYQAVKQDFEMKLQQTMQLQIGTNAKIKINVESLPEFQEQWRKVSAQLDSQYYKVLSEYKQAIAGLSQHQ